MHDSNLDRQIDRQTVALTYRERNSAVEILKIIAMFIIVIYHITLALQERYDYVNFDEYLLSFSNPSTDITQMVLMFFCNFGLLGNAIFFICSAWFLIDVQENARKRAFSLLCTVWVISILVLCLYLVFYPSDLSVKLIIKSIFPTTFANNWYTTCYIIFLFIYPWLNRLISIANQRQLLRITIFSSMLWIVMAYIKEGLFFSSNLILWVTIYFLIAYLKIYCGRLMTSTRFAWTLLLVGVVGCFAQVVLTNYLGVHVISIFDGRALWFSKNCNPFYIMIAIGSLVLALRSELRVVAVNYVSSLTLFIYLFHENILFKAYTRSAIWQYLYETYGYAYVVLLDLIYAIVLFALTTVVSAIYKETIQRLVAKASDKLYGVVSRMYARLERAILDIE